MIADDERIAGECNHPLATRPVLFGDARVADNRVSEVWPAFGGDVPDLEQPHGNAAVSAVEMSIETSARLQLEHVHLAIQGPDPREGRVEVQHHCLCAAPEHGDYRVALRERGTEIGGERGQALL